MTTAAPGKVRIRAHAKVNLSLRVGAVGADGFHPISTVFQTVSLADILCARRVAADAAPLLRLEVAGDRLPEDNTVTTAVNGLAAALRRQGRENLAPLHMRLFKRVPSGAGLGGGSSDAAAALRAGLALWRRDERDAVVPAAGPALEAPPGWLLEVAAAVGADVPFFLYGGTALGSGTGVRIDSLPPLQPAWLVVAAPRSAVPTVDAYAAYDELTGAAASPGAPPPPPYTPVLDGAWMGNDLAAAVAVRWPEVERARQALERCGARLAQMTGSGAASFGAFADRRSACRAAKELKGGGFWAAACRTISSKNHLRPV